MDFFLRYEKINSKELDVEFCSKLNGVQTDSNKLYIERLGHLDYVVKKNDYAMGDVIQANPAESLDRSKGIYYFIKIHEEGLECRPDFHGFLPVYYTQSDDYIFISSSFFEIAKVIEDKLVNQDYFSEIGLVFSQIENTTYF